jgi:hypothetical protein
MKQKKVQPQQSQEAGDVVQRMKPMQLYRAPAARQGY